MYTTIFKKGIPSTKLKNQFRKLLSIIQKKFNCEGKFRCMSLYHAKLLMNFLEDREINLPYFLLNSLKKMSGNLQKIIQSIYNIMYHHGLIKILIEFHLKSIGESWEIFLIRNHFQEEAQEKPKDDKTKISRRRKGDTYIEDKSSPQPQQEE